MFSNDQNLILKCSQIQHVKLSDHNTQIAFLSYDLEPHEVKEQVNFATTVVPDFDTEGADEEDWIRANALPNFVDWKTEFKNKSETDRTTKLLHEIEQAIVK